MWLWFFYLLVDRGYIFCFTERGSTLHGFTRGSLHGSSTRSVVTISAPLCVFELNFKTLRDKNKSLKVDVVLRSLVGFYINFGNDLRITVWSYRKLACSAQPLWCLWGQFQAASMWGLDVNWLTFLLTKGSIRKIHLLCIIFCLPKLAFDIPKEKSMHCFDATLRKVAQRKWLNSYSSLS